MSEGAGGTSGEALGCSSILDYEKPAAGGGLRGIFSTLGWAIYLGMSWTWCIGMFLPVLLVRDFGVWGWVVFAVPNVIGAAAMGWTISSAGQSRAMEDAHRGAMVAFSFVTAGFQIFFAMWMFRQLSMPDDLPHGVLAAALFLVVILLVRGVGFARWVALAALVVSGVCALAIWHAGAFHEFKLNSLPAVPIGGLALVCLFGFGLCPYLDLTFHRARQQLDRRNAQTAFGLGFGGFFFAMILFSLGYAGTLILDLLMGFGDETWRWWISVYFAVQLALTIGFHWYEAAITGGWNSTRMMLTCVLSATLAIGAAVVARHVWRGHMDLGELIYRLFMSFYGLVFPAYVWLCMIPNWRLPAAPTRRMWMILAMAIVAAGPFYWVGFIEGRMIWVVPGVLIVLASRALVRVPKIE